MERKLVTIICVLFFLISSVGVLAACGKTTDATQGTVPDSTQGSETPSNKPSGNQKPVFLDQYQLSDITALTVDSGRRFAFEASDRMNYRWQFGTAGQDYDYAGYVSEGIKLDGSDIADTTDAKPNSWAVNKFSFEQKDKWMLIYASGSSGCDANLRVRALWEDEGNLVDKVLTCSQYEKELDDDGWYCMDAGSPFLYMYDMTEFAGKTVAISIEQDDTGEGRGETVFLSCVEITDTIKSSDAITNWTIADIAAFWQKSGEITRHKEGICLEGNGAEIHNDILINGNTLKIAMRKFKRPAFEGQDTTGCVYVKINGNIVLLKGGVVDYVEVGNTEENYYYQFDVSAYNNEQKNHVEIVSIEVDGQVGEHICISSIIVE